MARIRTVKPDFWTDEKIVELSAFARLLFIGLWNFADDDGRMVYSPKRIKMQIFPADTLDISELFGELRRESLIAIYTVDNVEYLQVTNFTEHQKIDKRTASRLPPPPNPPELPQIPTTDREGKGMDRDDLTTPDGVVAHGEVINPEPLKNKTTALVKTTVGESELQAACRETWNAYGAAYAHRYKTAPVRNKPINSQIKQFVQRIGAAESPQVAAFYVFNNSAFYVKQMHSVGMLLKDAEKLRTEWATNHRITDTAANQIDKTQTNYDVWAPMIAEAEAREAKEKVSA